MASEVEGSGMKHSDPKSALEMHGINGGALIVRIGFGAPSRNIVLVDKEP